MKKIVSKLVHIDMRFRQAWERFERALKAPLMCLFFILWLVYVFYSPRQKLENQELETLQRPRRAVNAVLDSWLTSSPEPRVEPRGGNNLEIYLPKGSFESIPYPDREDFVGDIGRAWCDNLGGRYVVTSGLARAWAVITASFQESGQGPGFSQRKLKWQTSECPLSLGRILNTCLGTSGISPPATH